MKYPVLLLALLLTSCKRSESPHDLLLGTWTRPDPNGAIILSFKPDQHFDELHISRNPTKSAPTRLTGNWSLQSNTLTQSSPARTTTFTLLSLTPQTLQLQSDTFPTQTFTRTH